MGRNVAVWSLSWSSPCADIWFHAYKYNRRPFVVFSFLVASFLCSLSLFSEDSLKAFSAESFLDTKMNHFGIQQNAFVAREEMRGSAFVSDAKDSVLCPKPRRVGILANNSMRPLRLHINTPQSEAYDSKAGSDLLDIILTKDHGPEQSVHQAASSPPFFCGSPPSRAANPLVQDAQFRGEKLASFQAFPFPSEISSPTSSAHKGGCARMKFGVKPATVRVEGFDCLNRDRQNSRIPAMA